MAGFKNIILDLGGVVLDIDYKRTIEAFRKLGIAAAETVYSKSSQISLFDELEKGNVTEQIFYNEFRKLSNSTLSDIDICNAWNSLLIGLPEENVLLLTKLKTNHRLFLLSNTNVIHEKAYREMIIAESGSFIFDELFEKMYLSHRLHMRKPDPAIFRHVLNDSGLNVDETCFIDDSPQHIAAGGEVGIASFLMGKQSLGAFIKEIGII